MSPTSFQTAPPRANEGPDYTDRVICSQLNRCSRYVESRLQTDPTKTINGLSSSGRIEPPIPPSGIMSPTSFQTAPPRANEGPDYTDGSPRSHLNCYLTTVLSPKQMELAYRFRVYVLEKLEG